MNLEYMIGKPGRLKTKPEETATETVRVPFFGPMIGKPGRPKTKPEETATETVRVPFFGPTRTPS